MKKNQIIIFAIALMLITAGYLNYSMKNEQTAETASIIEQEEYAGIGDARLVSNNNVIDDTNNVSGNSENQGEQTSETGATNNNTDSSKQTEDNSNNVNSSNPKMISTSSTEDKELDSYYNESKLERNKMYSEMLESYQSIIANASVSVEQKNTAQTEISNINKQKNSIMIAENLIKNKGFKDVVIFINNESVSCVIRAEKIEEAEIAQIQSIIQRELSVNVENIHISNK
ncbi:MAG: SpoIIIAH-like family protein [Clostridia bacterium]|nr:SpoIIIAH-like family protein [Clostridia bacterium]